LFHAPDRESDFPDNKSVYLDIKGRYFAGNPPEAGPSIAVFVP